MRLRRMVTQLTHQRTCLFLSNRASVYLKLEQYEEALQDAKEYILQCPKCWRGYARKALALVEMNDLQGACIAASLAYYYERNIFRNFEPFKLKIASSLENHLFVCQDTSDLSYALWVVTFINIGRVFSSDNPECLPVIVLQNCEFLISLHTMDYRLFYVTNENMNVLTIENCVFLGEGECSVILDDNIRIDIGKLFAAHNVKFHSRFSNFHFGPDSLMRLTRCSFESPSHCYTSFCCKGRLKADFCKFFNCTRAGLLVFGGDAEIENSEFFGNHTALMVRDGGCLVIRKCSLYGNTRLGLVIGPQAKECVVEGCMVYDNHSAGINVFKCESDIIIKGNQIYDNDQSGVAVSVSSNVFLLKNVILRNGNWGVHIHESGPVIIKENQISKNQCGGICVDAVLSTLPLSTVQISQRTFVIEKNEI